MKWLARLIPLTRLFRLSSILKAVVPLAIALVVGAFFVGVHYQSGQQARRDLADIESAKIQTDALQAHQHNEATGYERRRTERARQAVDNQGAVDAFVDERVDLWACDIGPDGLRLYESWNPATDSAELNGTVP